VRVKTILKTISRKRHWLATAPFLAATALLAGCATPPPQSDAAAYQAYQQQNDPLEPTNRVFYNVNDKLDRYAFKPLAKGYVAVTTQGIRNHVGNFVTNIGEPAELINFMLSGKSHMAGTSLVRFVVNSTVGIGGIFDPASDLGYPETSTDFGLTLAEWGVPAGPYLYLPVFGPSGVRDAANVPVSFFDTPMAVAPESEALNIFGYSETALKLVNTRAQYLQPIDQIQASALDPYATFRSLYRQSRASNLQQIDKLNVLTTPDWYAQQGK
jgi:phospholipid-binding lipoprotein MlaA